MKHLINKRTAAFALSFALAAAPIASLAETASLHAHAETAALMDVITANSDSGGAYADPEAGVRAADAYNQNDYQKLRAFLEIKDFYGVQNGTCVNPNYDPDDPETWNADPENPSIIWSDAASDRRLVSVDLSGYSLFGCLDLSGCTQLTTLDVGSNEIEQMVLDGCTALRSLHCEYNRLVKVGVGGCKELIELYCDNNYISELDLTNNTKLEALVCGINPIEALDLSHNPALETLDCNNCALNELDLSANPLISVDSIRANGSGFVGLKQVYNDGKLDVIVWAMPFIDIDFDGWYTPNGTRLSGKTDFEITDEDGRVIIQAGDFIAKFSDGVFEDSGVGDADGDGVITVGDALITIRRAMSLVTLTDDQEECVDVDGDGSITVGDALTIIRVAMDIIQF